MAENQNTHFILENNPSNLKLIVDYFNGNKEFAVRIAKDPWIFNGNELKDLKEIPFDDLVVISVGPCQPFRSNCAT